VARKHERRRGSIWRVSESEKSDGEKRKQQSCTLNIAASRPRPNPRPILRRACPNHYLYGENGEEAAVTVIKRGVENIIFRHQWRHSEERRAGGARRREARRRRQLVRLLSPLWRKYGVANNDGAAWRNVIKATRANAAGICNGKTAAAATRQRPYQCVCRSVSSKQRRLENLQSKNGERRDGPYASAWRRKWQ